MSEKKEFTKETMLRAADEIYFVPEGTPLSTQLVKFQRNKKESRPGRQRVWRHSGAGDG